ncbi:acyl-CoA synthetase (NDP forming) [Mycobacterium frederiksbergense]|uniref:Acyl-CoA synthetase (NDP forming) n=1 Tax=Mycolicibacterium frederiksbergense TaxID=117567 RepID=A0ABT6L212_9MYCO|nr:acetate--CoA ligase family protein [Mycolicibacterium frederiksbergense]MDH6196025.1 acyl-CoA synthetase (NDP forming) [Mycolicibacterium frederiksbergense]
MQLAQRDTDRIARNGLQAFTDPASVAVVGASADPSKWGYWLAAGALRGKHRRDVYLVNSRAQEILGQPCAPRLADLPTVPELVALCVPAPHVPAVVDEALGLGVRGFLGITAGIADEAALADTITARGARLIGTNSLGIYDASTELELLWGNMKPGAMAIVSQSGQLGSELAEIGGRHGLGVSRFVSIGNQSDVTAAELLTDLAEHDATRVIVLYLESFADGAALFEALEMLGTLGKPTILLTVGTSNASARLARSHTGSLTSPSDLVDAACRKAGVIRANTPGEVIDIARMCLASPAPRGSRVAIVGDSGGQSGIAADVATAAGLDVPAFSDVLTNELTGRLPAGAATSNPVDLAGAGEQDLNAYAAITETLVRSGEVDAVLLTGYFGCYGRDIPSLQDTERAVIDRLGRLARSTVTPIAVHTMGTGTIAAQQMSSAGLPSYDRIEAGASAIAAIAAAAGRRHTPAAAPAERTLELQPGYWSARTLLSDLGVRFPAGQVVHDRDELMAAAHTLRAPFVLKAGWVEHKSEVGGVVTQLTDTAQLLDAFDTMYGRLGSGDYVVEEQDTRPDTVEILVGARRDPGLGAVVVVGAGGTETELHRDVSVEIAPVAPVDAKAMIERLRCAPLLSGWRGHPPVDVDALAELVATVSTVIARHPEIDEIELNPVRVSTDGPLAVDALAVARHTDPST